MPETGRTRELSRQLAHHATNVHRQTLPGATEKEQGYMRNEAREALKIARTLAKSLGVFEEEGK